jgi:lysyl-tRNA synthetase class 1
MNTKFSVHWLEDIIQSIIDRKVSRITLSTGKTPSGHVHIGILREILICDALRRLLENKGKNVRSLLFLDSLDAAKRFPDYIRKDFQEEHLGKPFSYIPCPYKECGCESYAHHFGQELISTFKNFGIKNQIIWSHELYSRKEMQDNIKIALEKTEEIKEILKKYILPTLDEQRKKEFLKSQETWMPAMVICEKCDRIQFKSKEGSILPNRVLEFIKNEDSVKYECQACKYKSKISIYSGRLKLNWRVDWPAKWALFETSCEPAGKDHAVKGGAYDTGLELCQRIYGYKGPIRVAYEWLRLGERDMKTSKGIVFTPKRYLKLADPNIYRMLILRTNPMKHIALRIEELPQYHDHYDKLENLYYGYEHNDSEEEIAFAKYLYPLIKAENLTKEKPLKIPFNLLTFLSQIQNILPLEKLYQKAKVVTNDERFEKVCTLDDFKWLLDRTLNWVNYVKTIIKEEKDPKVKKNIMNKVTLFNIPEVIDISIIKKLNPTQINGLKMLRNYLINSEKYSADEIQNKIFQISKEKLKMKPKMLFEAIYLIILGKKFGPRLGSFLSIMDRDWLLDRLDLNKN